MSGRKLAFRPAPDFGRLEKVLRRQGVPDRVPFYEIFSNIERAVLREIGDPPQPRARQTRRARHAALLEHIRHQYWLGYDYAAVRESMTGFLFPLKDRPVAMTAHGERAYMTQAGTTIANRDDFERYPWPDMDAVDYSPFEAGPDYLPDGMRLIADCPGVFENVLWLLGYETFAYALYDDPALVELVFEAVGSRVARYFQTAASFDGVGAMRYGDDLGFKTQLLLPPDAFRRYVLPWHRRIVAIAHGQGKPIILHACGNLEAVLSEIIDTGWDARHSFEDEIQPVWEAKARFGSRISHLGGFDMVKLPLMREDQVRAHTRYLVERCAPGGGWALGSGNSIAEYVPVGNLLAMLEEGYLIGRG